MAGENVSGRPCTWAGLFTSVGKKGSLHMKVQQIVLWDYPSQQ